MKSGGIVVGGSEVCVWGERSVCLGSGAWGYREGSGIVMGEGVLQKRGFGSIEGGKVWKYR